MSKTIEQSVTFPVSAETLYQLYMDRGLHAKVTGAPVTMIPEAGGSFTAYGGALSGRNLELVPSRMIVQAWRASAFTENELDSVLVLTFRDVAGGAELTMTHAGVPDHCAEMIAKGWQAHYWEKWQKYCEQEGVTGGR